MAASRALQQAIRCVPLFEGGEDDGAMQPVVARKLLSHEEVFGFARMPILAPSCALANLDTQTAGTGEGQALDRELMTYLGRSGQFHQPPPARMCAEAARRPSWNRPDCILRAAPAKGAARPAITQLERKRRRFIESLQRVWMPSARRGWPLR